MPAPPRSRRRPLLVLGALVAVVVVAAGGLLLRNQRSATTATPTTTGPGPTTTAPTSTAPTSTAPGSSGRPSAATPCGVRGTAPAGYAHVVWIVFENHSYADVIGNSSAPYLNALARRCGSAADMHPESSPSLPNYIAMTSGGTQGVADDAEPAAHRLSVPSIFSQLGTRWRALAESMPTRCGGVTGGDYAARHNPAVYYTGLDCAAQDLPLVFPADISAAFTFITPNICNDMHDCPVAAGDAWLSKWLPPILDGAEYRAGTTAVFVTWDEGSGDGHIPTLVLAPSVRAGAAPSTRFDHYAMLRTTEELLGLPPVLGAAATAPSMRAAFNL